MEWRCACALDIILWLYFSHFFCFVNLVFFPYERLSKCIDSGYLVGATPLTVFHQLFWNIGDVFSIEWRCACGFGVILWLFFSLFLLCELSLFFFTWNAIKVYRQWVPCGRNSSHSFPSIVLKLCRCFWHGMKMCMCFGYNTLIIFSHFFCYVNFVSFLTWNAIEVYR